MAVKITITGKVHGVGYRAFLLEEADSLLIPKFEARNVKINGKEALIVLIDGDKEQIESFVRFLKENKPENAVVEEIRVEEYRGTVRDIEKFRAGFTSTQLSKIIQVGLEMLRKQDETIAAVKEVKKAVEEVKEGVKEVSSKIDRTNELLEKRFQRLEEEVEKIKKALLKAGIEV
jgi:acylphosphatase/gas vesicle protein